MVEPTKPDDHGTPQASVRALRTPKILGSVLKHLTATRTEDWQWDGSWCSASAALAQARLVCRAWAVASLPLVWRRATSRQLARVEEPTRRAELAALIMSLLAESKPASNDGSA
jgi:hypothetical protein